MQEIAFGCKQLCLVLILAAAAWSVGLLFMRVARVRCPGRTERTALATALGLGWLGTALFWLGLAHALYPQVLTTLVGIPAAVGTWRLVMAAGRAVRSAGRGARGRTSGAVAGLHALAAGLLAGALLPAVRLTLGPPVLWDSIMYHLPAARLFADSHALATGPFLRYPVFPQLNEMLFTLALVLSGDRAAQGVELLATLLVGVLLWGWGRRQFGGGAGVWAAAFWLGSSLVIEHGTVAYVDVGLALFVASGVCCYLLWREGRGPGWVALAGLLAGFAAATKYTGLFWVAALGAFMWIEAARGARFRTLIIYFAAAAAVAPPWYVRNAVVTGNPVFPFLGSVFGYGPWTAADLAGLQQNLHDLALPRTAASALTVLWHLLLRHGESGVHRLPWGGLPEAGILIVCVGWAVALGPAPRRLLTLCAAFFALWFATAPQLRYFIPALPLLLLVKGAGLDRAIRRIPWVPGPMTAGVVALLVSGILVRDAAIHAARIQESRGPLPLTESARKEYLTRVIPSGTFPAYDSLNTALGRGYAIYSLYDTEMRYYARGTFIGDWFGVGRYSRVESALGDSRALYRELRGLGADHFLVADSAYNAKAVRLPEDAFFRAHFAPEMLRRRFRMYRMTGDSALDRIQDPSS